MTTAPDPAAEPSPGPDPTRFVLLHTSHAGNVGAAARAMKVMGFSDLVLVRPRFADVLCHDEAVAMASGAADILARARIVDRLDEALHGVHQACATAMTPRDFGPPTAAPRAHFEGMRASGQLGQRVAFVFGTERFGLSNDDVYRCHACISVPTDPARTPPASAADMAAVRGAVEHWQRALVQLGFLDPAVPKKLLPRLQQLLNRAQLSREEVHILRGIAGAIEKRC